MTYEECEYLNKLTAPRAAKHLKTCKAIKAAGWGLSVLLAFLLGLAM